MVKDNQRLVTSLEQNSDQNTVHILVVDDEDVNVYILEKILFKYNMKYDSCSGGKEAIKKVEMNDYDVVLLDVMLTEMNGFEVCEYLHKLRPELPVIILTSLIDDDSIRYSFKYGAVDYIKKPINEVELVSRVENVIKIRSAERSIKKLYQDVLKDLNLSTEVQKYLLPEWVVRKDNLMAISIYEPSSQVSGDLYDILELGENKYLVYMGDISGHGVHAALLMTAVKSLIQSLVIVSDEEYSRPHKFLTRLNKILAQTLFKQNYITLLCSVIDLEAETITVYNAGHPPLIAVNKQTGKVQLLGSKGGCPLGWFADSTYSEQDEEVFPFTEGTSLLMYTDGVFECMNDGGDELGLQDFLRLLDDNVNEILHSYLMPQLIKRLVHKHGFTHVNDDFAILKLDNIRGYFKKHCELFFINSFLTNVADLGRKVEEKIKQWTNSTLLATKGELIVNECLNNIISHGFDENHDSGTIALEVTYEQADKWIVLKFYDKGLAWNFESVLEEKQYQPQDRLADSGRGVLIIASLASRFSSKRYDDTNETIITLIQEEMEQEEKYLSSYAGSKGADATGKLALKDNDAQQ